MQSAQAQVRQLLDDMRAAVPPSPWVDRKLTQLETLMCACMSPPENAFEACGKFTVFELRMLNCLVANLGKLVRPDQIMAASYFDQAGDGPEAKVVDVRLCAIRRKLKGMGYRIDTIHSAGYRLVKE